MSSNHGWRYRIYAVVIFLLCGVFCLSAANTGWLIMLDGTSSAGKTSISRHLKTKLLEQANLSFCYESMDDFNDRKAAEEEKQSAELKKAQASAERDTQALSSSSHSRSTNSDESAPASSDIASKTASSSSSSKDDDDDDDSLVDYFQFLKDLVARGKHVIADAVLRDDQDMKDYKNIIGKGDTFVFVMVYCPAIEITRRVQARNLSGNKDEERTLYQAIAQIPDMYTLTKKPTKQTIDSITKSDVEEMLKPLKEELIKDNKRKRKEGKKEDNVPHTLQVLRSSLVPYKGSKRAYLQPKMPHDLVAINSRRNGPIVAAQKITDYVLQRMNKTKSNTRRIKTRSKSKRIAVQH